MVDLPIIVAADLHMRVVPVGGASQTKGSRFMFLPIWSKVEPAMWPSDMPSVPNVLISSTAMVPVTTEYRRPWLSRRNSDGRSLGLVGLKARPLPVCLRDANCPVPEFCRQKLPSVGVGLVVELDDDDVALVDELEELEEEVVLTLDELEDEVVIEVDEIELELDKGVLELDVALEEELELVGLEVDECEVVELMVEVSEVEELVGGVLVELELTVNGVVDELDCDSLVEDVVDCVAVVDGVVVELSVEVLVVWLTLEV